MFRKIKKLLGHKLMHYGWDIAILDYDTSIYYGTKKLRNYHIVKNTFKDKWFADPFILSYTETEIYLLVEEFDRSIKRGRIAKVIVDRKSYTTKNCIILLDLPTHLSFPVIYRIDDTIWVMPENSASGQSSLYRLSKDEKALEFVCQVSDQDLVDAIIQKEGDYYYMFATSLSNDPNGSILDVFRSQQNFAKFEFYAKLSFESKIARMAGAFDVLANGQIIRPSQDCHRFNDYGQSVYFQASTNISSNQWSTIGQLLPPSWQYAGLHTINHYKDMMVVDLKKYDYPLVYKFRNIIKSL